MALLGFLFIGLIAGGLARLLVPGPQGLGCIGTMVLGVIGSFVGGTLSNLLAGDELFIRPSGLIGSVIGAIIVLVVARLLQQRRR
ncbi:hypothetical protein BH23ACT9_BH23ACT9_24760 [soil metagenome]